MSDSWWDFSSPLWWNVCWFCANAVVIGRRGYIFYKEEGLPASEQFALRANSMPYVSIWGIFAIATIVFGVLAGDEGDCVNAVGVLVAEFVAVCLWAHYYGNGELVSAVVKETRERLSYLLAQGLGMNTTEREQFFLAHETAIVELWKGHLKEKRWSDFTSRERNALLFDTGVECGKVLEDQLWEGVLHDVAAFFHEWRRQVEEIRGSIRVPKHIAKSMISGNDAGSQSLLSVAVLVANEDVDLRRVVKDTRQALAERQFSAARIARRKTAGEGILRWPDSVTCTTRVHLPVVDLDTTELFIVNGKHEYPCNDDSLPYSVLYTLYEIIRAGYLKIQTDGTVQANVTFKYGNMVFNKDQWDPLKYIERKPFRFITSATWMSGEPAFVVEQREITATDAALDGSGFLKGTLKLSAKVEEIRDPIPWIARSTHATDNGTVWGNLSGIADSKSFPIVQRPMMWTIHVTWWMLVCFKNIGQAFLSLAIHPSSPPVFWESLWGAKKIHHTAAETLVLSDSKRKKENSSRIKESKKLRAQYRSRRSRQPISNGESSKSGETPSEDLPPV